MPGSRSRTHRQDLFVRRDSVGWFQNPQANGGPGVPRGGDVRRLLSSLRLFCLAPSQPTHPPLSLVPFPSLSRRLHLCLPPRQVRITRGGCHLAIVVCTCTAYSNKILSLPRRYPWTAADGCCTIFACAAADVFQKTKSSCVDLEATE